MIFLLLNASAWANVTQVEVNCPEETECKELAARATGLLVGKKSRDDIEKGIEFLLLDQSLDSLKYEIHENDDQSWSLVLNVVPKLKVSLVRLESSNENIDFSLLASLLPFKENGFYEIDQVPEAKRIITDFLSERGFSNSKIELSSESSDQGLELTFKIEPGEGIDIKAIRVQGDILAFRFEIESNYSRFLGMNWNAGEARRESELLEQSYFQRGFWGASVEAEVVKENKQDVLLVNAVLGEQYLFSFNGLRAFSHGEIVLKLSEAAKTANTEQLSTLVQDAMLKAYDEIGYYNVKTEIRLVNSKDRDGVRRKELFVKVTEGEKTKLNSVKIDGNQHIDDERFEDILADECSVLVCRNYYDRKYFVDFTERLRREYLAQGHVMANVTSPEIRVIENKKIDVRYNVIENHKVQLSRISLPGVPDDLASKILSKIKNKVDTALDVTSIESDMSIALETIREEGYFFARTIQTRDSKIVRYGRSYQTAQIVIPFDVGKKTYFDGILVTGNNETKSVVVERELEIKKGDLVTSREINRLRDRLVALGLFANVTITPFLTQSAKDSEYWLSLLVEVKERDFGLGELSPGFRTDLGPKAGLQIAYNNVGGLNRTVAFRAQTNLRLNSSEFDARRSSEDKRLLEFAGEISYREPWLWSSVLGNRWEFEFATSFKRQRFFSFDADIFRIGPRLSKQFGDHLTASVRYQFEDIRQFDASEEKDGDRFQIGGITPSLTLDFRDSPVIPTKGAFFGLSWEFANPRFGSQDRDNLVINFSKLTSRNRFYYPVGNLVFALSVSAGYQRNFASDYQRDANGNVLTDGDGMPLTVGYIPSIKVFRLDGVDNVRGFGDDEINRLGLTGMDIGELRIQDTVTFVNYKFEPRYYFSDLFALGVFFDAGGLYVNQFVPFKVRTAVGLSAKLVTPVGSLDFDYGVKLNRRSYASQFRESFGRFHLSIGSF